MGDNITSTYRRDAWQELSLQRRVDTDLEEEKWEVKSYFWANISQRYLHFLVYGSNVHANWVWNKMVPVVNRRMGKAFLVLKDED